MNDAQLGDKTIVGSSVQLSPLHVRTHTRFAPLVAGRRVHTPTATPRYYVQYCQETHIMAARHVARLSPTRRPRSVGPCVLRCSALDVRVCRSSDPTLHRSPDSPQMKKAQRAPTLHLYPNDVWHSCMRVA